MAEVSDWYDHAIASNTNKPQPLSSSLKVLERINTEDINPCLKFNDETLSVSVAKCVQDNSIAIEPITCHNFNV